MKAKVLVLGWYYDFKCPGGDCGLTCCTEDWSIFLTDEEIEKYRLLDNDYREEILKSIDYGKKTMKCSNGKCNLMNDKGYCNIVLNCGEEYLSFTCATFPRHDNSYGDVIERFVEPVCPVVARNFLDDKPLDFAVADIDVKEIKDIDYNLYDCLSKVRSEILSVMQLQMGNYQLLPGKLYIMFKVFGEVLGLYNNSRISQESISAILDKYCTGDHMVSYLEECARLGDLIDEKAEIIRNLMFLFDEDNVFGSLCGVGAKVYPKISKWVKEWINDADALKRDLKSYIDYMRVHYPYFTEKYFAYVWFSKGIAFDAEDFERGICSRCMEHLLINLCAMSVYKENGDFLEDQQFCCCVAAVDRLISHAKQMPEDLMKLYNKIKDASFVNLLLMIEC